MKTALYWKKEGKDAVRCTLCPHSCLVREGESGKCGARTMLNGELKAATYGLVPAANVDPMEKKPLYHFMPGASVFSVGSSGCNFECEFCQNWTLSRKTVAEDARFSPEDIVASARNSKTGAIAFTYNEPLVGFEFVKDCAALAKRSGIAVVLVTNGFVQELPAAEILPEVDALNIDIKSMDPVFYKNRCHGELEPVLRFARQCVESGCHVEITNLVIPGLNDSERLFHELSEWIAGQLGPRTPLHLSAYRPEYKMSIPPTPADVLIKAHDICRTNLNYVYLGNLPLAHGQNTECPDCGALQVERTGYHVALTGLRNGKCSNCGKKADFVVAKNKK